MTRSSRHKSSKHRDVVREYSDSEKDSSLKDRKSKEESGGGGVRVSKESGSSEKRKLDLKEGKESGNGVYVEDLVTSKRRKERVDDGGSDRWNGGGGEYDHRGSGEGSKKSVKASGDSKSRKRDGSVEMYGEGGEVVKKSGGGGGKGEGKHRDRDKDSSRKEGREGGGVEREREKKSKDGRSERLGSGGDEQRLVAKQGNENADLNGRKELESPEPENQIERRMRKRRDDSGDADEHLDYAEDINGGRLSSRDDIGREGRQKDEKRKDERYREKFREDLDRDNKHRDEKQRDEKPRDERSTKDHLSSKSEDKHLRDEKDIGDMQLKRSKLQDGERKGEHDRDRNRDRESYHVRERERYHDREREHGWDHGRDRERDYDRDWDWDRERDGDRDRERNHDRERARDRDKDGDRDRDHDYDRDYDGSHLDDRSTRYKESSRGKRRSPDDRDDSTDTKSRSVKPRYSDFEKKSSSGDRLESDVSKGRSQSRQAYVDTIISNNKRRTSPSSNSNAGIDEFRYVNSEDIKYRDSMAEQRSKALPPRDVSGASERGSKYRSMEKSSKMDDSHLGELSNEKPSGSKASPMALMERSPSSSSIDRRYMNKSAVRRSIDIEETGRRSSASMDNRDFSNTEDRPSRDLPLEKPFMGDSSPADSSTHNRSGQSNFSSPFVPHSNFRAGESPSFGGSGEDDGRARYRRSSDPNLVRGPWRGVPNWPSPVPNGFMPFPHGAPGFQGMLPQFSAPPLFGVRPSMEMNHYAIPYQIADDRFSTHLRPLGSQNMMEGLGPTHMNPWDGNTGAFRDDSNSYGAEWDQNRHPMSARGWDPSAEPWKVHNNDGKRDLPSPSPRNDYPAQTLVDDGVAGQVGQMSHHEDNLDLGVHAKTAETRPTVASPMKESPITHEKSRDGSKLAIDKVPSLSHYYLSKLDISAELVHTELYTQCMSLLDTEGSATVDEDPTMHTVLKAATAGLKSSKTLLTSSLFPPLKDSVFQKAMDLYKKQRMEAKGMSFVAGGRLDIILASNQKNMEEKVCEVEKVEQLKLKSDAEMADAPVSSSDEKDAPATVPTDSVEEKLKELVSTPAHEMQNHSSVGSPELEMAVEDSSRVEPEESQTISNGVEMDSISAEHVEPQVDNADGLLSLDNKASLPPTTTLPAVGSIVNEVKDDNSIYHAEEGVAVDAIRGPLVIPDGSPKACEALMSGSNESDSVASVLRNTKLEKGMKEKSTHFKTHMAGIGFKEPISMVGKERYAKGQKFMMNSVIERVRKIGGSKRKGFDSSDDLERGLQFQNQKMDMDSIFETKESIISSVRKDLKVDALYSIGTIQTENSLPRATCIKKSDKKKSTIDGDGDKRRGLRPKPKNMKLRKPVKKEITTYSIDATSLPEEYKRRIENFDQAKATLVIQKELTKTDLSLTASRLSMPMNQIRPESFLNADEIKFLAEQNDWPVSVIDPLLEEEELTLRQWNMPKNTGKMSSSYVLKTSWNEFADKNSLQPKDVVQVWSFRDSANKLHFAIVLVKKGEQEA